MEYMLLVYTRPGMMDGMSDAELKATMEAYMAIQQEPGFVHGAQLQPSDTATTVRIENSETLITDGPFADTKEVFAGYYLFDLDNLDRALELAARVPSARLGGSVEVRGLVSPF
jgi:hypothetical protein